MTTAITQMSDSELISLYAQERNEPAMRTLVSRYHSTLHSRFRRELPNEADARDLQQQLWLKVVTNLESYNDEGKFANYLSRIAGNLITDFRRSRGRQDNVIMRNEPLNETDTYDAALNNLPAGTTPDDHTSQLADDELVDYLVNVLIPALPPEQRTAWLLQHESEYWDFDNRLQWQHLARLNGMSVDEAWHHFESAREKLLMQATSGTNAPLTDNETLIFMVWTQAQRPGKNQKFTWDYFAKLLGVPVETMKTRYRSARLKLSDALNLHSQGDS